MLWLLAGIVLLAILLLIAIQLSPVQNFLKDKAVTYLHNKLHTQVAIGHISIIYPKDISIENIFIADQTGDTLIESKRLAVNLDLPALIHTEIIIRSVQLQGFTSHITRLNPKGDFNFGFITKAFSSKPGPARAKDTSSLRISLSEVELDKIHFSFQDTITGYHARINFNKLHGHINQFDLKNLNFSLAGLTLSGLDARVKQEKPVIIASNSKITADTNPSPSVKLRLAGLEFSDDKLSFLSPQMKLSTSADIHKLDLKNLNLDLGKDLLSISELDLSNSTSNVNFLKAPAAKDSSKRAVTRLAREAKKISVAVQKNLDSASKSKAGLNVSSADSTGWKIDIGSINLQDNRFSLTNENDKPLSQGIDYSHLSLTGLTFKAGKIHYEPAFIRLNLAELAVKDKSGFTLRHAAGNIYFDDKRTAAENMKIETAESNLDATVRLRYMSVKSLSRQLGNLQLDALIRPSFIGLKDVLYFQPALRKTDPFKSGLLQKIKIKGSARGKVNNLSLADIEASALAETHLLISGNIKGLPDFKKSLFDLNLKDLSTGKDDINQLLANGTLPESIQIPRHIKLTSTLRGSLSNLNFNSLLASSLGNINAHGLIGINSKTRDTTYHIDLDLINIQAGQLSHNKQLGLVSLNATIAGSGLSLARANSSIKGNVRLAEFRGYNYHNLALNGHIAGKRIQLQAAMPDPNLSFKLTANADLNRKNPAVQVQLHLDSSNFKALRFSKTTLKLHGILKANIPNTDLNHPEADIRLNELLVVTDSASIPLDSLHLQAHSSGDYSEINLNSEFFKASASGKIPLTDVGGELIDRLNNYYPFTVSSHAGKMRPSDFKFNATIFGPPALHKLLPRLASFNPVIFEGSFNSLQKMLVVNATAPHTQYADISIDNLKLGLNGDASRLDYSLTVDSVSGSGFDLESTRLSGYAAAGSLHLGLNIKDDDKKSKYQLAAVIREHLGNYQFRLSPDDLIINYQNWKVAADNLLQYGKQGILAHNIELSNQKSSLTIHSSPQVSNAPLEISFSNFDLATVSKFVEKDSVIIRGQLDGKILVDKLISSPVFTSDLVLSEFSYKKDTLGTIKLKVDNKIKNTFTATANIQGHGNEINLTGEYDTGNSSFNADLNIRELTLSSIQVYLMNQISHAKGYFDGRLNLSGTVAKPLITGNIGFKNMGFNLTYLNSTFTLPDQQINFNNKGIHFSDFILLDSAKNKLDLDGDVLTQNYRDYNFDLNLSSQDFRILNSPVNANAPFYGTVYLNSDIDITGSLNKPKIDANLTLNNKTRFTYAIPADDPSLKENNGIVEFVSKKETAMQGPLKKPRTSAFKGFDFSANLNIEKDAEFTVIIDPQTGDALRVKGEATLNTTIDASGKISLTGRYEISEGSYQLSLNSFIKKSFKIQKGSTIVWTGEPTSATVDITAIYLANAPAIDLMDQQTDASTNAKYKQLLPFQLYLMMNGELLKPVITFSISLPERERNLNPDVQAQLDVLRQDPSELNKQVFALLVLGRFVGQNPFQSAAGGGFDAGLVARQSAGKIMSQQLNKIAGNLIKGVDLNFDLNSQNNYASGERTTQTDLKIGATKNFNDRLSVSVGSDIALEGSQGQTGTSTLIGDVSVEYKLSKDGRYRLRAFRRNATQEYVQGQFIETGLSFIFVLDYDKFIEIFKAKKQEKFIKPLKP